MHRWLGPKRIIPFILFMSKSHATSVYRHRQYQFTTEMDNNIRRSYPTFTQTSDKTESCPDHNLSAPLNTDYTKFTALTLMITYLFLTIQRISVLIV